LPHYFGIDTKQNYLSAPPSVLDWNKYKNNFKIGLTWAGSPAHQNDHNRSLNCLYFKEICKIPNVKVFSLQKDLYSRFWPRRGMAELSAGVADLSIVNVQDHMKDFYTTAGVIQEMDLIISCDSAVAHVAGALGKPTWLLLPFHPDWRWSLGKDRTIWYDSFKLFRQRSIGVWDDVVNELSQNLIDLLKHSV
jgi:hypothetical protein